MSVCTSRLKPAVRQLVLSLDYHQLKLVADGNEVAAGECRFSLERKDVLSRSESRQSA